MRIVLSSVVSFLASVVVSLAQPRPVTSAPYDVVVYGGVPCGISAAIAAAREGARVLLIEPTKHVGGLSTSGLNTAETEHMLKWTFGGVAQEFYERLGKEMGQSGPAYFFLSGAAEKVYGEMLSEAQVMGGHAAGVAASMAAKSGVAVQGVDLEKLQGRLREQKQVIDFVEGQPEQFPHTGDKSITR